MSIVTDVLGLFSDNNPNAVNYDIYLWDGTATPTPVPSAIAMSLYAVYEEDYNKQNSVVVRNLEGGIFTSDSQQIRPYSLSLRGLVYPDDDTLISNYDEMRAYIGTIIDKMNTYQDNTQLFMVFNNFTFSNKGYWPLKFVGFTQIKNQDTTIPELTMNFLQVQYGISTYSNQNVTNEPQTAPAK